MKKIFLVLGFGLISLLAPAQSDTLRLSSAEAVEYGLKNRKDVQNQRLSEKIARNETEKVRARNLPQVTTSFDYRYNTQLQTTVFPANVPPFNSPEPVVTRFGTAFNATFGVSANYDLINPATQADKRYTQKTTELEQANSQRLSIDTRQAIFRAYYAVLLNQEKAKFSSENQVRTDRYFQEGKVKFENRTILKTDLDRLQLDYQNARVMAEEDAKNLQLSRLYLANQIGAAPNTPIATTETLETVLQLLPEIADSRQSTANRVEVRQEQLRLEQNQLNLKRQSKSYWPTVSLYGSWNVQNLSNDFALFSGSNWFPFSYVGLKIGATLFDGLQRERTKTEYRLRLEQNQNNLSRLQSDMGYEWESARTELQNAHEKLKTARENYTLAQQIVQTDNVRFNEGIITIASLKNSEYALATAQNNLLTNYYNFLLAKINYQKALGEL
jgi:outer membrane protein TolC